MRRRPRPSHSGYRSKRARHSRARFLRRLVLLIFSGGLIWACCRIDRLPGGFAWRPDTIIIHHSATPPVVEGRPITAQAIDEMHARRGFRVSYQGQVYHIGYHYVVLPDGRVQPGRPEGCIGAHARHENAHSLGICLVGNFSSAHNPRGAQGPTTPGSAQMEALTRLCAELMRRHSIPVDNVVGHRDVGQTACPGDRFPLRELRAALRRELSDATPAAAVSPWHRWWQRVWNRTVGDGEPT